MRFYTTERLSTRRARTPEGYLLCEGAPLARTGIMHYADGETPIRPAEGQETVQIHRTEDEVFAPLTIASYAGKPLTNDHPAQDVTPLTWRDLACGMIMNPRRGTGDQDDCLLGDVLITDPELIKMVESNDKTELSAGYDADYEELSPGIGRQRNIIINHVALVEQGRCGPRCRIGDEEKKEKPLMSYIKDLLLRAYKAKDEKTIDAIADEAAKEKPELAGGAGASEHHVHVHLNGKETEDDEEAELAEGGSVEERLARLEALLEALVDQNGNGDKKPKDNKGKDTKGKDNKGKDTKDEKEDEDDDEEEKERKRKKKEEEEKAKTEDDATVTALGLEAPPGTEDRAMKARDSSYLEDAWRQHIAYAEIIVPGARMPTFDAAARPAVTLTKLCGARTALLEHAYTHDKVRAIIDEINGNRMLDFKRMTCDAARTMIAAVASQVGKMNNAGSGFGLYAAQHGSGGGSGVKGKIMTPADLNKIAKEMYKRN